MKLNPDLLREILLYVEEHEDDNSNFLVARIDGYSAKEIGKHTRLLAEEKLIEIDECKPSDGYTVDDVFIDRLTKKGHDFLAAYREPKKWRNVKSTLIEKGIGITLEALFNAIIKNSYQQ